MRFLGTGSAEGTPTPFCRCKICENARLKRGKEQRTRSSFRIDEKTIIDPGADFIGQAMMLGEDFYELENAVYTHTHEDHFDYMLPWVRMAARQKKEKPLTLWFTEDAVDVLEKFYYVSPFTQHYKTFLDPGNVIFKRMEFGKASEIGGMNVTPFRGNHASHIEKNSANYLIEFKNGRKMYYGLDTGYYFEETFSALKGAKLDLLISELTFPCCGEAHAPGHMNLTSLIETMNRLFSQNTITEKTKIYLTHIQPHAMTHEDLEFYFLWLESKYKINVAYDGLYIEGII